MNNYPKYKCHKIVEGFQILRIERLKSFNAEPDAFMLWPTDADLRPLEVTAAWLERNKVAAGGYLVIYEDGYQSFSPATAFENGYALVSARKPSKFDKVMRRIFLGVVCSAIAASVGLLAGHIVDRFKSPGSWSFVNEKTGATCIVLDDAGRLVMNCLPATPKPAIPATTHTTIITEDDSMFFPESRT